MAAKTESTALLFIRSLALGLLLSMLAAYALHVFGKWVVEDYRPNADTTYTVLLHNRCALFGTVHTLRPGAPVPAMDGGINGTKLGGSFLVFYEGHVPALLLLSLVLGAIVFAFRRPAKRLRDKCL